MTQDRKTDIKTVDIQELSKILIDNNINGLSTDNIAVIYSNSKPEQTISPSKFRKEMLNNTKEPQLNTDNTIEVLSLQDIYKRIAKDDVLAFKDKLKKKLDGSVAVITSEEIDKIAKESITPIRHNKRKF